MQFNKIFFWFETTARIWILRILSLVFIISGIILFPLPIPFGLIFILIGLMLLVSSNQHVANYFKKYRKDHPDIDEEIRHLEEKTPPLIRKPLEMTDPD